MLSAIGGVVVMLVLVLVAYVYYNKVDVSKLSAWFSSNTTSTTPIIIDSSEELTPDDKIEFLKKMFMSF